MVADDIKKDIVNFLSVNQCDQYHDVYKGETLQNLQAMIEMYMSLYPVHDHHIRTSILRTIHLENKWKPHADAGTKINIANY